MAHFTLRRINHALLALIIIINLYIIVAPFVPALIFWWQKKHSDKVQMLEKRVHESPQQISAGLPGNRLISPTMLLDEEVHEGKTTRTLNKGLWRIPHSSTPDKGGNTVVVGHRFTYTDRQGTFYFLDKLHPGDELGLSWNNKKYVYRVASREVVPPDRTSVEAPTIAPQLTLYTCTPLWNPNQRLVVVAHLEKIL